METPSQPSLSRIALGALDANKHLNSPHTSPKKSPTKKAGFVFDDSLERPATYSLKEQLLEVSLSAARPASPQRVTSASPSRNEKRKVAPTSILGDVEDVLRHAKHARVQERSTIGHGHMLEPEVVDAADLIRRDGDGERESSQEAAHRARPPFDSFNAPHDDSQLMAITEPDIAPSRDALLVPPTLANPTESELRENAAALRLRLKFAMYKLKTNQLDIPLSRLELLSPASPSKPSHHNELAEDALSDAQQSAPCSPPDSATPQPHRHNVFPAPTSIPPSPLKEVTSIEIETQLPPYLQSSVAIPVHYNDLTSSVVQDRAADGLLSLMGIRPQ